MTAETLLNNLRADSFSLSVTNGLLYVIPTSNLSSEQRAAIRERKAELLALLYCPKCQTLLTHEVDGLDWCATCNYQRTLPQSGFWVSNQNPELKEIA